MSSNAVELRAAGAPSRIGQGTAVEQSRAVAEVQAQVIVAQQMPRDINRAVREMQRSCAMKSLAEKAFYRYSRGGQQISGPSVQLARELARAFGNVQYGITELRRDDEHGQSEMLAFAWDLETNTRSATTFIVQHVRDTRGGSRALTDQRDIYELNANNGARRLREMIFAILPGWYTEDAVAACHATLAADSSDGGTVAERAAKAAERFGRIGVTVTQLEQKLGAPQARWTPSDLAQLAVIWKSIERGETTTEAEFGASPGTIKPDDLAPQNVPSAQAAATPIPAAGTAPPAGAGGTPKLASKGQVGIIRKHFERLYPGEETPEERRVRLDETRQLAGRRDPIGSTNELTADEAAIVIRALDKCTDAKALAALLSTGEADGTRDGEGSGDGV